MSRGQRTKTKTFTMRCDDLFLANLERLSNDLGVSRSSAVEITINIYPALVELQTKLEQMVRDAKEVL